MVSCDTVGCSIYCGIYTTPPTHIYYTPHPCIYYTHTVCKVFTHRWQEWNLFWPVAGHYSSQRCLTRRELCRIKVWSSPDGHFFELRDVLNVSSLRGTSNVTALPLLGDASNWRALPLTEDAFISVSPERGLPGNAAGASETHAQYWRINPGGARLPSTPRTIGLCSNENCTNCANSQQLRSSFLWAE